MPIILLYILPIVLFSSFIEHRGLQVHLSSEVQYGPLLDTHGSASVKKRNEGFPVSSDIVLKKGQVFGVIFITHILSYPHLANTNLLLTNTLKLNKELNKKVKDKAFQFFT